jgi:hypothetical protein
MRRPGFPSEVPSCAATHTAHGAVDCRWGEPTLFAGGDWITVRNHPWCCVRGKQPHILRDPVECLACPHWQPRDTRPHA